MDHPNLLGKAGSRLMNRKMSKQALQIIITFIFLTSFLALGLDLKTAKAADNIYVTFYIGTNGSLKVNGAAVSNGTVKEYSNPTTLNLEGYNYAKYYWFSNFTWNTGHSYSNPYTLVVSSNLTLWTYFRWSPTSYPPDFPSSPLALPYLVNGDYLGFVHSIFYSLMGQTFYAFIMLILYVGLYLRLKTIAMPSIAWLLMGGFWAGLAPAFTPVPYILSGIGVAGILYSLYSRGSEN